MNFWSWLFPKKVTPLSDSLLSACLDHIFPPLELKEDEAGNKYHLDYSIDRNLESILADLQIGINDEMVHHNLRILIERLQAVRDRLDIEVSLDRQAKYFVVDCDPSNPKEVDFSEMDHAGQKLEDVKW